MAGSTVSIVRHLVLPASLCLTLVACGTRSTPATGPASGTKPIPQVAVATVAVVDGQTLVELPLGRDQGLAAGDFFRIHGSDGLLKATVLVKEVIGPDRLVARVVGASDRTAIAPGDIAQHARDLSGLAGVGDLQRELEREQQKTERDRTQEETAHTHLREDYQRRLAELHERHLAALSEQQAVASATAASREQEHAAALDRLRAEHRAELAALRAALTDEARTVLAAERQRLLEHSKELRQERDRLALRLDELLRGRQQDGERLTAQHAAHAAEVARLRGELTAESETRQALEERIAQLQARLEGRIRADQPVLTQDPGSTETVLARLERIGIERDAALSRERELAERLAQTERARAAAVAESTAQQEQISLLTLGRDEAVAQTAAALRDQQELANLRARSRDLEIAQLRTERAYYDLAGRLLAVEKLDALADLQTRLRQAMSAVDEARSAGEQKP